MKLKFAGIILTIIGVAGLTYAVFAQLTNGMAKSPIAGITLVSILVVFIGVAQLFRKPADGY